MVLLRDLKPLLGKDFAYQWGSSTDFAKERRWEEDCNGPCAAMLGAVKGGSYIQKCMAHGKEIKVKKEVIQTAAMCVRILEHIEELERVPCYCLMTEK